MTAGVRAGLSGGSPAAEPSARTGGSPAAHRMAPARPDVRADRAALTRRLVTFLFVIAVLGGTVLTIDLASSWTASVARFPEPGPGVAQLEAELAAEQARSDDLQAQLDSIIAASAGLAAGMDEVGARLGGDTNSAQSLRTALAAARARLSLLHQALANTGVVLPTRAPLAAGNGTPGGAAAGAILPGIPPVPTAVPTPAPAATYPPGVPASWPSNRPIPPMPSPCVQPKLEDNGVWNCQV